MTKEEQTMKSKTPRSLPIVVALAILLAAAGSPALAEGRLASEVSSGGPGQMGGGESPPQEEPEAVRALASPALSSDCNLCLACGGEVGVCAALCSLAAATKSPGDVKNCGICLMGVVATSPVCYNACKNCLTGDRSVACQDYNSWSREMCTTEEWVCCNAVQGCYTCAPYGGYCPADSYNCGYGSKPVCDADGAIEVFQREGITVAEMVYRELQALEPVVDPDAPRIGRDLAPAVETEGVRPGTPGRKRIRDWHQRGPNSVYAFSCDDGGGGGGGGGGTGGTGGGGSTTCTDCSCQGEYTSWEGTVCGTTVEELVEACWSSCD